MIAPPQHRAPAWRDRGAERGRWVLVG